MDGYASSSAAMIANQMKITYPAHVPEVIIGDVDVLKYAPMDMIQSGYGDILGKYSCLNDWKLGRVVNDEYFCDYIYDLTYQMLTDTLPLAQKLLNRDEEAVKAVFEGLVICGAGMKLAGCSRPASGIEHYFSHIWDMRGAEFDIPLEFHGIQCAVGTLLAARIYEKIKLVTPNKEKALAYANSFDFATWSEELRAFLGKGAESMIALEEKEQKYNIYTHKQRICVIIEKWEDILKIVDEELPAVDDLIKLFNAVGLPKTMAEIGVSEDIFPMTFKSAKDIRDKYVLPRLCWDLGIIDEIVEVDF
jgi:glycerol-1-phosphate dehydrogenase [NAD(P)+]